MNLFCDFGDKKLGFGCMRFPMKDGNVDMAQVSEMVDEFMKNGFCYFDTAHGYLDGKSETALKACLTSRYPRGSYLLTDKLTNFFFKKEEDIRPFFESQLEACGVDYFDFYLMHAQSAETFDYFKKAKAYETAFALKKEGKIRHVGISFHDKPEVLEQILTEYPEIEVVQIQFNYVDFDDPAIQSGKCLEVCRKFGKPVIVMEPVKGGNLEKLPADAAAVFDKLAAARFGSGKESLGSRESFGSNESVCSNESLSGNESLCSNESLCGNESLGSRRPSYSSYALRYAAGYEGICMVLSGMSSVEQIHDNISFMKDVRPLDEQEIEAVDSVRKIFRAKNLIQCTACRYCVAGCPKHILIPDLFACMNAKHVFNYWNSDFYYHDVHTKNNGKASDCIKCGKCEKACPQHLPVRKLLEKVAAEFDSDTHTGDY